MQRLIAIRGLDWFSLICIRWTLSEGQASQRRKATSSRRHRASLERKNETKWNNFPVGLTPPTTDIIAHITCNLEYPANKST